MSLNVAVQVYRGTLANLAALATTGKAGVLAWTTDTNEIYVDSGAGSPGIGAGKAWQRIANDHTVQTAANQAARLALTALVGDLCVQTDINTTFMLTASPASVNGNWTAIGVASGTAVTGLAGPTTNQWVAYVDTAGVQHLTQPAFSNISGALAQTQLPTSIGSGSSLTSVDCGTF